MKQRSTNNLSSEKKDFAKLLDTIDYHRGHGEKFRDFCELTAWTLQLPFNPAAGEKLKPFMSKYKAEQIAVFQQMFDIMVNSLEEQYHDFLGSVFMSLDMGNEYVGQFFTPYPICQAMAKMQLSFDAVQGIIKEHGFFTCNDPAVGAGALLIAVADELRTLKIDHSNCVYMVAQDIDYLACCMCFIQLSLCGVAATVINCDSIWPEEKTWHTWHTPVYYLNNWWAKIELRKLHETRKELSGNMPVALEQNTPVLSTIQQPKSQLVFDFCVQKEAV